MTDAEITLEPEGLEDAAKAVSVSRGLEPTTLHQIFDGDVVDHTDTAGRKYVYGWRGQQRHAEAAIRAYLRSTLPREGQGDENKLRRMAFEDILNFKPDPSSEKSAFEQIATHARATVMEAQTAISALSPSPAVRDGWQDISTAPHACHVLATHWDQDCAEWIVAVVQSPPSHPFTYWKPLPVPLLRALSTQEQGNGS